jgi:hypothetical protein
MTLSIDTQFVTHFVLYGASKDYCDSHKKSPFRSTALAEITCPTCNQALQRELDYLHLEITEGIEQGLFVLHPDLPDQVLSLSIIRSRRSIQELMGLLGECACSLHVEPSALGKDIGTKFTLKSCADLTLLECFEYRYRVTKNAVRQIIETLIEAEIAS